MARVAPVPISGRLTYLKLCVEAFEIADQQQPKLAPGWHPWSTDIGVESLAESFDVTIEVVLVEDLIQPCENGCAALRGRSVVDIHIDVCFARARRLPIAIGDSVVRGIDPVDP